MVLAGLLPGCFFLPFDPDPGLVAQSPCHDVNIMNGLDEESTGEIRSLYDCLNQSGDFDALEPAVDQLVTGSDRHVSSLGTHAAHIFNRAPDVIPIWETLTAVRQLLLDEDEFLLEALHLASEWVYGVPWPQVQQLEEQGQLQDADLLANGPLGHLVPVLRVWAEVIVDEHEQIAVSADPYDYIQVCGDILDHLLSMPELLDTLITLRELLADNANNHLFDDFPLNWGEFFIATHDDTTGDNTLIDALDELASPATELPGQVMPIEAMMPSVDPIVSDLVVRERLVDGVGDLYDNGTLSELPDQLIVLMTIDMYGGTLGPDEESAFEAALVLLDEADSEFNCFDLIEADSVSVWLLQEIVILGLEADTIEELVALVEGLYDWFFGVVDLMCTVPQILETHFEAIIRLAESGALQTLIPLLYALADPDDPSHNYLRELVDIVHILVACDSITPIERLLVPTLGQDFMPEALAILGAFVDPDNPLAAGDVYTLLDVMDYLITPPDGEGYPRSPLIIGARAVDGIIEGEPAELDAFLVTWGELLVDENAVTNQILYNIDGLLALDPELQTLDYVGDILGDPDLCEHWLLLFEHQGFMDALGAPGTAGGDEVPMALLGRLVADGTTSDLVLLLGWMLDVMHDLGF